MFRLAPGHWVVAMLGELLALMAALTWSVSVILFKRSEAVSPHGMNLFKNVAGLLLLALTMLALDIPVDTDRSRADWIRIAVSGALGVALADTLIFTALRILGPSRLAVVDCVYAPLTVGAGILFLGDPVSSAFAAGAVLVVAGVLVVSTERSAVPAEHESSGSENVVRGVALGVAGIATMAIGIVLAKPVLDRSSVVEVTAARLMFGVLAQFIWLALVPRDRSALRALLPSSTWKTLVPASFLGSYLAVLMWLGGFKYSSVSVASVLNQMSTVFTIVLARVVLGEAISPRRAFGGGLAILGALLILVVP